MKKILFLFLSLFVFSSVLSAQTDLSKQLPVNPDIKIGKLQNGLTYYILHNEEPKDRADFYIIYSVGSLQETDAQNGLAHFLEHMAFNGTKNFPGGNSDATSIVKTLERHALAFGRNINAYTTYDRTVYHLDAVPTTDEKLIDTCLLVLHDWAHYVSLESEEIDNERGVISEEWRTRQNSDSRIRKQWFPLIFGDTKYSTHDVIGSYDIINNFTYDELRQFYYDWYRTDQQAVAVVGDVDVAQIEKKIQEVFSSIPAVENPKQKEDIVLPVNDKPLYVLATDKEETKTTIQIMMLDEYKKDETIGGLRAQLADKLYNSMLGQRIGEKLTKGEAIMAGGGASRATLINGYNAYNIMVLPKDGLDCKGLELVYTEAVRAQRHGFLQSELDRAKVAMNNDLDSQFKQKDKIANSKLINEIVNHFVYGNVPVKFEELYSIKKALISEITLDEINKLASGYPTFRNEKMILTGPSEGWNAPTQEQIQAVFDKVDADKTIAPYVEEEIISQLIDHEIASGSVVKEKQLPVFGAKQWTLSNGAKVVYAKADYDKDLINLSSNSYGGKSLYSDDEVKAVELAATLGPSLGLGKYPADKLDKFLHGKKVKSSATITSYAESVIGESNREEFETLMQMTHLRFVEPKFDKETFLNLRERFAMLIQMLNSGPSAQMTDSLTAIVSNYNKRAESIKPADIKAADLALVEKYYRERICDASDFTFFIVGDIEEDVARKMAEKYIGSIPSEYRNEKWKNDHIYLPKGHTVKSVEIPFQNPKANVVVVFNNTIKVNPENTLLSKVLASILRTRYIANIREKEGGTYSISAKSELDDIPENSGTFLITFETAVDKAEHLKSLVLAELDNLIENGVTQDEIDNVVKNMLKEHNQIKAKNAFVMSTVKDYVLKGIDNSDPKNYEDILAGITSSDIQNIAKKYFRKKADCVEIIFTTEKQ
ncbi:MAG: insulinase family protein [Bacteroidales bacterium]|nr:insulinase family protein [Candidatus Cacconaster equi]